jgi:hypothetical protein
MCILEFIQTEQEKHNSELTAFLGEVTSIREWLEQAKVMSCIAPILQQLAVEGKIPDAFYPQVFKEEVHST